MNGGVKAERQNGQGKGKARADESDGAKEGSPKGSKRARMNDQGDGVPRGADGEEDEEEATPPPRVKTKTLPRDVDGFIPGSIVRIQLRNFVTYDAVEFRPGPFLNMILGPNGTGKSSIACAICLGLNWSPEILGRAKDLNSFVKIGADSGHIEIELKSPPGSPNLVIKRSLSAKTKSSSFTVNGKGSTGREVTERVGKLNVQVGNLCSFLPQDKVSSFAAMSPTELLRETQRAAGDEGLEQWHKTLIEAGKELKGLTEQIASEAAQVRQMQERNENIERDVQRYRDRKKIERNVSGALFPFSLSSYPFVLLRLFFRLSVASLKAAQRAQHLRNQPAHALFAKLEAQYQELHAERDKAKKALRAALQKVERRTGDAEAMEGEAEDVQTKLQNLKKAEKARISTIKNAEAAIEKLEKEMEVEDALKRRENVVNQRRGMNQQNERRGRDELKNLDNLASVKLNNLGRWDRDAADAVQWLRANKNKFRMEVFEPPALSVSVPDQSFASGVENCFSSAAMRMFVCQCPEDYETLNNSINDNPGLGRRARVPTWCRPGAVTDLTAPPMSKEELELHGFDGYAIDYVECPEGLKWYLMRELNMHRTAISRRGVRDLNGAIQLVGRTGPNGRHQQTNFIDRDQVHQVQRSRYGQRHIGSSANKIGKPRNFAGDTQVNPAEKARIDDILAKCKQETAEIQDEEREIAVETKRLAGVEREAKAAHQAVEKRLQAITAEYKRKNTLKQKLTSAKSQLASAQSRGDAVEEGKRYRKKLVTIGTRRVKLVAEAVDLAREVINEQVKATTLGLEFLQIGAKKDALKKLCDRKDAKYQAALLEFNKIDAEFEKLKTATRELLAESKELLSGLPDEMREEYQETEQERLKYEKEVAQAENDGKPAPEPGENVDLRSMDELQQELEKQEANLEMNMNTNPGVVEQYEKRKRDIEVLQNTIDGRERRANKIDKEIKVARDNWEPALQALVASIGKKFSAAFDRIGCAGEIRVRQEEAYENWAIDILVKFRDTEKLQLLTGQRQSGGERSLTTILYLMSLTEEARAPFSLVDEINQGMDQRAERMVHNSMVEVTCKPDSAQYFLITPKLLPDLEYHERMKILCVNNGEWLPDESGLGNMMSMIDGYVAQNPAAGKKRRA
ncbi:P-loop containing nucleoside triphosphate hydrolase protein [Mycena crocata]|nr:P-loop containing nucleoside triphosphate hydrolase protein [Mycena crocata]